MHAGARPNSGRHRLSAVFASGAMEAPPCIPEAMDAGKIDYRANMGQRERLRTARAHAMRGRVRGHDDSRLLRDGIDRFMNVKHQADNGG